MSETRGAAPLFPKPYRPYYDETFVEQVLDGASLEERIAMSEDGEKYIMNLDRVRVPIDFRANLDVPLQPELAASERLHPVLHGLVVGALILVAMVVLL